MSHSHFVSNGVRQGSVLSPVLFAVYLDGLLQKLSKTGVGCYWGTHFVGAVCYADRWTCLVPSPQSSSLPSGPSQALSCLGSTQHNLFELLDMLGVG